jgi:predicted transcriptional regulator
MGVYMKTIIKQIDEKNEEIADTLIFLGMSRPVARTLSYLQNMNSATTVDLERGATLCQPEVCIAMKQLKERDWINEREDKKPGKGRPYKVYSLKVGFDKIIAQIEKQQSKAADEARSRIERLKELRK